MNINEDFEKASKEVHSLKSRPSNDTLLQLYGLFKQGSEGDVSGKKPGMLDIKGRKKYEAWENLKGMDSNTAKEKYISLVNELLSNS